MTDIQSHYAILDVKEGRGELARRVRAGEKIRATIEVEIDSLGNDDGVSREFNCVVRSVKETA